MNVEQIKELHLQSFDFELDSTIESLITSSTLGAETLKFMGCLLRYYQPANILEFGSGLSTVFLVKELESKKRIRIFTVDDSHYYIQKTESKVGQNNMVTFLTSPIKLYQFQKKCFVTYDNAYVKKIPKDLTFDFVLIDGPLALRFGREAPLYQISPFINSKTLILLDDANRPFEQEAIANWQRVWYESLHILHFPELKRGLAVIQIDNPQNITCHPFGRWEIVQSWLKAIEQLLRNELRRRLRGEVRP